jgi:hypothetical protein
MKSSQASDYNVLLGPVTAATTARSAAFDVRGADYATILVKGPRLALATDRHA